MALSVAERKERMPHGGQRKAARRMGALESYISAAMAGEVRPKTKRSRLKLRRAHVELAKEMRLSVEDVFRPDEIALTVEQQFAKAS